MFWHVTFVLILYPAAYSLFTNTYKYFYVPLMHRQSSAVQYNFFDRIQGERYDTGKVYQPVTSTLDFWVM